MRRATGIGLVLLGGGLAFGLSTLDRSSAECRQARAERWPDVEQICARSSSSGRSSGSHSGGSASASSASSQRGGFGATAARFFSGGG